MSRCSFHDWVEKACHIILNSGLLKLQYSKEKALWTPFLSPIVFLISFLYFTISNTCSCLSHQCTFHKLLVALRGDELNMIQFKTHGMDWNHPCIIAFYEGEGYSTNIPVTYNWYRMHYFISIASQLIQWLFFSLFKYRCFLFLVFLLLNDKRRTPPPPY